MSDTPDDGESSGAGAKSTLLLAAVGCVACCIGPIFGVLGGITALGLVSTIFIGAVGLLVAAAAAAVFIVVRQRRSEVSCSVLPEPVTIELTHQANMDRDLRGEPSTRNTTLA
jgi:hypothetical protein